LLDFLDAEPGRRVCVAMAKNAVLKAQGQASDAPSSQALAAQR